jgi:tetratricopeptide (TPR) repeat protein
LKVRDAHNLYLETLSELGVPGLLLLVGALGLPLVCIGRRRELFAAAGAYAAFLAHAAVDWDWEIPAVTLAALLCGAALLAAPAVSRRLVVRRLVFGVAVVLGALGIYTIAAQLPLTRLRHAAANGNLTAAERDARRAAAVAPWSSEPWFALGESELNAGRRAQAIAALRKATAKSPHDWVAWFDLARASSGAEATRALERATALNPLSPEIAAFKGTG